MSNIYIKTNKMPNVNERLAFLIDGVGYSASAGNDSIKVYVQTEDGFQEYTPTAEDYDSDSLNLLLRVVVDDTKFDYRAHKQTVYQEGDAYDYIDVYYLRKYISDLTESGYTYEEQMVSLIENESVEDLPVVQVKIPQVNSEYVRVTISENNGIPMSLLGVQTVAENFEFSEEEYFNSGDIAIDPVFNETGVTIVVAREQLDAISDYATIEIDEGFGKDPMVSLVGKVKVSYVSSQTDNEHAYLMYQDYPQKGTSFTMHFIRLYDSIEYEFYNTLYYNDIAGILINCDSSYATLQSKKITEDFE